MPVPPWFAELLELELRPWLKLSAGQVTRLHEHYELLQRWNRKMNLTTVAPGPDTVIRHYCESLFFGAQLPRQSASMADIGSGAGFPGIPLAVMRPDWRITLVESNKRKAVFLREATRGWSNISVRDQRADDLTENFDWIVSRAVDPGKVVDLVPRLARKIGLMLAENDFFTLKKHTHIAWSEAIRLPWGDRRLCVFGVSRGTFHVEQE